MSNFTTPVSDYMTTPAVCVQRTTRLSEAYASMRRHDISGLAVTDGDTLVGVITQADLVSQGQLGVRRSARRHLVDLPEEQVGNVMTGEPVRIAPDRPLHEAARTMDKQRIHRLFVEKDGKLVGVLSTFDLMRAVHDHGVTTPVRELATSGIVRVDAAEPVSLALDRIQAAHVRGIVVTDQGWPVGVFTQADVLATERAPLDAEVGDLMNPSVLVLPEEIALHRAAAQASAMRARHIVVTDGAQPSGIVSGLDFARAVR